MAASIPPSQLDAEPSNDGGGSRGRSFSAWPKPDWSVSIGETLTRREVHGRYGGQQQGGISTPKNFRDLLVFTNSGPTDNFGYARHEGLQDDGTFSYTGEGQVGDQKFSGGNLALRDSAKNGRLIRLFTTRGPEATYVGTFTTGLPVYRQEIILDKNKNERTGIIFNLEPVEAEFWRLPPINGERAPSLVIKKWKKLGYLDFALPLPEIEQLEPKMAKRLEFRLQNAFGEWLITQGTPPQTVRILVGESFIQPDFYVPDRAWIVEAKPSVSRSYVRAAIGQVLDYVHCASLDGVDARPVILLPGKPESTLASLAEELGIIIVYQDSTDFRTL